MTSAIHSTNAALVAASESLAPRPTSQTGAQLGLVIGGAGTSGASQQGGGSAAGDSLSLSATATAALGGLTGGFSNAASAADAAASAGNAIVVLLGRMKAAAESAANPGLGDSQRAALDASFRANLGRIEQAIESATTGGVNLLKGSPSVTLQTGSDASLTGFDFSLGGPVIGLSAAAQLSNAGAASEIGNRLGQSIDNATQAVGQIVAQGQAIQGHLAVISQAALSLTPGVAASPDLGGDGARLLALQVQQQLAGGGAGANQTPQPILALFRA